MRFIHTADLHLGAAPDKGHPWAEERAEAIRNSIKYITDLAETEAVDLLLIAGDLFHRQPLRRELKEATELFRGLSHTRVVLIAGNSDYVSDASPYQDFIWPENVSFLSAGSINSVFFEDLNTEVHGISYSRKENRDAILTGIRPPEDGKLHILLAHGGDDNHIPLHLTDLASSGFDYIALGHLHQPRIYKDTRIAMAGSPEPIDHSDPGPHGCLLGEVTKETFNLGWHAIASTSYQEVTFVSDCELSQAKLESMALEALQTAPGDIFSFTITGSRNPGVTFNTKALADLGRVRKVVDQTTPEYDLNFLLKEHSGDILSYYIRSLSGENSTPQMKKALFYGLRALLNTDLSGKEQS